MTKSPETAALVSAAFKASGHKTYKLFCAEYGCAERSFYRWLSGKSQLDGMGEMIMRQIVKGFHPK